jgi:hypothetical protein
VYVYVCVHEVRVCARVCASVYVRDVHKQVCMCERQCRSKGEGREADMQLCVSQVVVIHSALLSN